MEAFANFGMAYLVVGVIIAFLSLGVFVWFAKKIFDNFNKF